jgi:Putative DNA-binding domain
MDLLKTYERLETHEIEEYIRLGQEEHLHLEFKTVENSDLSKRDDRKNFAICISGFANSDGGLIVWGVDARKNEQKIDCATAAKEIDSTKQFVTKLNEFTGQAVSPFVGGIRHKPLETSSGKGFAATLVPESMCSTHGEAGRRPILQAKW